MRRAVRLALCLVLLAAGQGAAQDMATSPRPVPRPVADAPAVAAAPVAPAAAAIIRPKPRPVAAPAAAAVTVASVAAAMPAPIRPRPRPAPAALPPEPAALALAAPVIRPMPRPSRLTGEAQVEQASAAVPDARPERRGGFFGGLFGRRPQEEAKPAPADGYVCGDPAIRGEELAPVTSRVRGCGIEEPVRVTSVDGIRLTTPATIECGTARALKRWINDGMRPAFGRPEVVELRIAASYICRPRNNVRGAKISEHGRGKAVDISGFILSNGRELSVANDYNRTIRKAHKAACGIFGTTLGPGSDGYHEDHLHFDISNMDRPYCR